MNLFLREDLLQYIWQHQYLHRSELTTTSGERVQVLHPGTLNRNQGPDFLQARIQIGNATWAGAVELHIKSSDWIRHGHSHDPNYEPVVLHVVWEMDVVVNNIPVIELRGRVSASLMERYATLMHQEQFIPCENLFQPLPDLNWIAWRERLLTERLLRRKEELDRVLEKYHYNWEELCWQLLARNFGMRLNADAFEAVAATLPVAWVNRYRSHPLRLEALLLGQAGLLEGPFSELYPRQLQKEYRHLARALGLQPVSIRCVHLRMRPVNFPAVRLAQLARVMNRSTGLFAQLRDASTIDQVKQLVQVQATPYWDTHYRVGEPARPQVKKVGDMLANNVVINTAVPLLFAYAQYLQDAGLAEKALSWMEQIDAEPNQVVAQFRELGFPGRTAADSQALLELKKQYCDEHKCLDCTVGHHLLKMLPTDVTRCAT